MNCLDCFHKDVCGKARPADVVDCNDMIGNCENCGRSEEINVNGHSAEYLCGLRHDYHYYNDMCKHWVKRDEKA